MPLGKGGNYVWCLIIIIVIFTNEQGSCGDICFKVIIWDDKASHREQDQFYGKEGFSLCSSSKKKKMHVLLF